MSQLYEYAKYNREQADKYLHSSLIYGGILILFHLTDFNVKKVEISGASIDLRNISVIYGCVSLIFMYFIAMSFVNAHISSLILPMKLDKFWIRSAIKNSIGSKKNSSITVAALKKKARIRILAGALSYSVVYFPILAILLLAFACAFHDIYRMGGYLFKNSRFLSNMTSIIFDAGGDGSSSDVALISLSASGVKLLNKGEFIAQPCEPIAIPKGKWNDQDIHNYIKNISYAYRSCAIRHSAALSLIDIAQGTKNTKDKVEPNLDLKKYQTINLKMK